MASPPSSSSLPTRRPPTGLSVLIAGAGIGGLVAALELWRHGFSVRIIEKTASPSSLGKLPPFSRFHLPISQPPKPTH